MVGRFSRAPQIHPSNLLTDEMENVMTDDQNWYSKHWRIQRGGVAGVATPLNFQKRGVTSVAVVISTVSTVSELGGRVG